MYHTTKLPSEKNENVCPPDKWKPALNDVWYVYIYIYMFTRIHTEHVYFSQVVKLSALLCIFRTNCNNLLHYGSLPFTSVVGSESRPSSRGVFVT